jgi:hypothetical protein
MKTDGLFMNTKYYECLGTDLPRLHIATHEEHSNRFVLSRLSRRSKLSAALRTAMQPMSPSSLKLKDSSKLPFKISAL